MAHTNSSLAAILISPPNPHNNQSKMKNSLNFLRVVSTFTSTMPATTKDKVCCGLFFAAILLALHSSMSFATILKIHFEVFAHFLHVPHLAAVHACEWWWNKAKKKKRHINSLRITIGTWEYINENVFAIKIKWSIGDEATTRGYLYTFLDEIKSKNENIYINLFFGKTQPEKERERGIEWEDNKKK